MDPYKLTFCQNCKTVHFGLVTRDFCPTCHEISEHSEIKLHNIAGHLPDDRIDRLGGDTRGE